MAESEAAAAAAATAAMETEAPAAAGQKREREEGGDGVAEGGEAVAAAEEEAAAAKKQKVEGELMEEKEQEEEEGKPVKLGPKEFASSVEMFDYFFGLLHSWSPQLDFNKYEHLVLEDLLKKGHSEPTKKIGPGIDAFEIRNHPVWRSLCFFVRRVDGSSDDFSFRKCVDNILPLPEDMKIGSKKSGGHQKTSGGRGGRGRGGRGGGRGGRGRGRRGS